MSARPWQVVALGLALAGAPSGCVYLNGLYNAEQAYAQAERARLTGDDSAAAVTRGSIAATTPLIIAPSDSLSSATASPRNDTGAPIASASGPVSPRSRKSINATISSAAWRRFRDSI